MLHYTPTKGVSCKYRILSPGKVAPFPASRMEDSTLLSVGRQPSSMKLYYSPTQMSNYTQ